MSRPVAAVVGLGVGEQHAKGLLRAGCELRWVHDLDPAKSHEVVSRIGAGRVAESFDAILADEAVELVVLATYDDHHAAAIVKALSAGKHVFCEKPLCQTAAQLTAIEQAWKKSGRHLASNLILRTAPLYRKARELVSSGALGDVYAFYGDYLYGRLSKITTGWRAQVDDYSVMQGGGVHLVDLMCWITGDRPVRVQSAGNRVATEGTAFRYQDFVASTFACRSGMTAVISANFACVHRHQHVVRIFGTKGTFLYDDMGARVYRERDPGGPAQLLDDAPLPASKGDLVADFLEGVANAELGTQRTALDLRVIRACLAADEALARGTASEIDPR